MSDLATSSLSRGTSSNNYAPYHFGANLAAANANAARKPVKVAFTSAAAPASAGSFNFAKEAPEIVDCINDKNITNKLMKAYDEARDQLVVELGTPYLDLTEDQRMLIFASLIAHYGRPYDGASGALSSKDFPAAKGLGTTGYDELTWDLFKIMAPNPELQIHMVGWKGPRFNTSQLMTVADEENTIPLLIDPAGGFVAKATCEDLTQHKKGILVTILDSSNSASKNNSIRHYYIDAIENGHYPDAPLYCLKTPEDFFKKELTTLDCCSPSK